MAQAKYFERASGVFFFSGFMLSKLQYIPHPIAAAVFRFVSLGLYLLAYGSWFTGTLLQPQYKKQSPKWYGFAELKEQFLFSSFVGFVATIVSVVAISIPMLLPVAACLYAAGNILWAIGEYHKLHNPPAHDTNFSYTRQNAYFKYSLASAAMSLVIAATSILIVIFPLSALPISIFSLVLCIGIAAFSFENWLNATFGQHPPTAASTAKSYCTMKCSLGAENAHEPSPEPAPHHSKGLFSRTKESKGPKYVPEPAQPDTLDNENPDSHILSTTL